jgi:hypothetical protein
VTKVNGKKRCRGFFDENENRIFELSAKLPAVFRNVRKKYLHFWKAYFLGGRLQDAAALARGIAVSRAGVSRFISSGFHKNT